MIDPISVDHPQLTVTDIEQRTGHITRCGRPNLLLEQTYGYACGTLSCRVDPAYIVAPSMIPGPLKI